MSKATELTGRTVDLTPTWRGVLRLLVETATNNQSTPAGRAAAWSELERMAALADDAVAAEKARSAE